MPENISHPLVVSPHFDDAVISCGAFIAAHPGSVVHTVFSGCPAEDVTTDWDQHCGFTNAAEAMRERACEDDFALEILGAVADRDDFLDAQYAPYGTAPTVESIASKLGEAVRLHAARTLLVPLGLFHSDHELVHRACIDVWNAKPALKCFAYEDALYRRMSGLLQARLADLAARGISATPEPGHWRANQHDQALKREAVKAYASQLKAFGPEGYDDVFCTERCWKLELAK
jgi:LmbE family N-acetylglucosaminyl deacetylase